MPQLHCYVSDSTLEQLQHKADKAHLSISKYIGLLIQKDIDSPQTASKGNNPALLQFGTFIGIVPKMINFCRSLCTFMQIAPRLIRVSLG